MLPVSPSKPRLQPPNGIPVPDIPGAPRQSGPCFGEVRATHDEAPGLRLAASTACRGRHSGGRPRDQRGPARFSTPQSGGTRIRRRDPAPPGLSLVCPAEVATGVGATSAAVARSRCRACAPRGARCLGCARGEATSQRAARISRSKRRDVLRNEYYVCADQARSSQSIAFRRLSDQEEKTGPRRVSSPSSRVSDAPDIAAHLMICRCDGRGLVPPASLASRASFTSFSSAASISSSCGAVAAVRAATGSCAIVNAKP